MHDRIEIALSKTAMKAMALACVGFVAVGIGLVLAAGTLAEDSESALATSIVGSVVVAFFGFCGVVIARKLRDRRPGLVIDGSGIVDNSGGLAAGTIPWIDILGFYEYTIHGQAMVAVKLRDPEKYIARGNFVAQAVRRANYKLCGSPVTVAASGLQIQHEELLRTLQEAAQRHGIGA